MTTVDEDWKWPARHSKPGKFPAASACWKERLKFVETNKRAWKGLISSAVKDYQASASAQAEAEHRADGIAQRLKEHGLAAKAQQDDEADGCHRPECGRPCLTLQGLGKHRLSQHGTKVLAQE